MTANPIDLVGGLDTTGNVSKVDFVAWVKARVRERVADASEINSTDLTGQYCVYVAALKHFFDLDSADHTTADDGSACLVDSAGNRFKLSVFLGFPTGGTAGQLPYKNSSTDGDVIWATPPAAREVLAAGRTYYVRTDGNDSNNGLTNSSGGAFLTLQKAINVCLALDLNGHNITVQIGNGTYTSGVNLSSAFLNGGVTLTGNTTTPSNVVINTTSANCIQANNPGVVLNVQGVKLVTTTSGNGVASLNGARINITGNIECGIMGGGSNGFHMYAQHGSIAISANYLISGGAQAHWYAIDGGYFIGNGLTITLSGTPAFSIAFARADRVGILDVNGNTFSGSATGTRYSANGNSVIYVNGAGATYLPGSVGGAMATGGQYY